VSPTAALRFQPTKRPQIQQKGKPKSTLPKPAVPSTQASVAPPVEPESQSKPAPVSTSQSAKPSTLADWQAIHDENEYDYLLQKRERGGKKRKKNKQQNESIAQNWDDVYDPSRPTTYEEYRGSEEQNDEINEWKNLLYRHRLNSRFSQREESYDSLKEEEYRPNGMIIAFFRLSRFLILFIARFAPPPNLNDEPLEQPVSPPRVPNDNTGEEVWQRRLRMSQQESALAAPSLESGLPPVSAPPQEEKPQIGVISAAPVRYNIPPPEEQEEETTFGVMEGQMPPEEQDDRPERPKKKDIGRKLLEKMGWQKGQGLGAQGTGIINPLQVKLEKRKKLPDSQGGGFSGPAGMGKIIGGKKGGKQEESKFGAESVVIALYNMLDGLNIDEEIGELTQEIGEKCNKFGNVERVFIHRYTGTDSIPVFIKFVEQVSALNVSLVNTTAEQVTNIKQAVNNLNNEEFRGNTIKAKYFDVEKFEKGEYE